MPCWWAAVDERRQLAGRIVTGCVRPVHRAPDQRHVAPVVVGWVERMHRHQLDHVDPEVGEIRKLLDAAGERLAEAADVQLVDDRVVVVPAERRLLRPGRAHDAARAVGGHHHVHRVGIEQRTDAVGDEPVHVAVVRIGLGLPRHTVRLSRA